MQPTSARSSAFTTCGRAWLNDLGSVTLSGGAKTISSPSYSSGGITVSGGDTLTLSPGVYLLGRGVSASSSNIVGEAVALVTLGGAVGMSGGSIVNLNTTMPSALANLTIAQLASNTNKVTLSGGSDFLVGGSSSTVGTGPNFGEWFVVKTVVLSGSASVKIDRTGGTLPTLPSQMLMD